MCKYFRKTQKNLDFLTKRYKMAKYVRQDNTQTSPPKKVKS